MAKKAQYLLIDSIDTDQTTEMFNAICERALNMPVRKVKKEILKLDGTPKELDEFKPTIVSLITLIRHFDIKCELKVIYATEDISAPVQMPVIKPEAVKGEMEKQEEEITNPELLSEKLGKKVEVVEVVNSQRVELNQEDIPDFD